MASTFGSASTPSLTISSAPAGRSASGRAFLGRLKDELDRARQPILDSRQDAGGRQQDGHVRVVPAGVHDADVLPFVLGRRLAGERDVDFFANRQAVHVGAQRHDRARPAALEHGDDAGAGDAGLRLEPEGLEAVGDVFRRLDLAVGELGVLVQIPAPLEQLGLDRGGQLVDFACERRCADGFGPCCAWTDGAASRTANSAAVSDRRARRISVMKRG